MFLAFNEIRHDKTRFLLIVAVIALVSYLTFFLTALAYGLATSYTQGIAKWQADGIILQQDANDAVGRSLISGAEYDKVEAAEKARLGVGQGVVWAMDKKQDVAIFGLDGNSFIAPNIIEGRMFDSPREVVISDQLKAEFGIGDKLHLTGSDEDYSVVGYTDAATFQTSPLLYMSLPDWRTNAAETSGMQGMRSDTTINAVVVRGADAGLDAVSTNDNKLQLQSINDYYFKLPGYQAQVLTFSIMIGFLILIASFVLAIFIYILTIQKKNVFGVLKAEGVPNRYILRAVKAQILLLLGAGLTIGLASTLLTGVGLGGVVPFLVRPDFFAAIAGLFLLCAVIGGAASVWAVTKIDPVEAIG